jgi:hypothetical protein
MDNLSKPALTTPATSRENKQNVSISQNKTVHSNDLIIKKTVNGTFINLKPRHKQGWGAVQIAVPFNASASWTIGEEVRVMPGTTYVDGYGSVVTASWGVWQCINDVPDQLVSDAIISNGFVSPQFLGYVRDGTKNYVPVWPEPSNACWQLMGTLPTPFTLCASDGSGTTIDNVGIVGSGSQSFV